MESKRMNRIVKFATDKFTEVKDLILQESELALNAAEDEECDIEEIIAELEERIMNAICNSMGDEETGAYEDESENKDKSALDAELKWFNEDGIDWGEDYKAATVVMQLDEKGDRHYAVAYEEGCDEAEVPAILGKGIVEALHGILNPKREVLKKRTIDMIIGDMMQEAMSNLMMEALFG